MTEPRTPFALVYHDQVDLPRAVVRYLDTAATSPEIQRVRAAALDALAPQPGQRLLDAGCGAGEVARELGKLVGPDGSVTALDSSADNLAVARERHDGGPVWYVRGDIAALDFADGEFDGVRAERVLQHLDDPDRAIRELARVTRPGGRVCVIDTDWTSLVHEGIDSDLFHRVVERFFAAGGNRGNATMGRTCRGRMVRAGLADPWTLPVTMRFTDPQAAAAVLPMFRRDVPVLADMVGAELWEAFSDSVGATADRDEFLVAITMWVTVGRPAGTVGAAASHSM
jgi:ubiquinone/menaquinone biosynthesis C-methylase UbiE